MEFDRRACVLLLCTFFGQRRLPEPIQADPVRRDPPLDQPLRRPPPERLQREPGVLTIDLNQWTALKVKHGDHEVEIPVETIWQEIVK